MVHGPSTPQPIVPIEEQIENSSLHYEESIKTWFLFTNHIGIDSGEYTDAIWVYWSKDLNQLGSGEQSGCARRSQLHLVKEVYRSAVGCSGRPAPGAVLRCPRGHEHQPHAATHRPGLAGPSAVRAA